MPTTKNVIIVDGGSCKGCGSTGPAIKLAKLISMFPEYYRKPVAEALKGHRIPEHVVLKHIWAIRHYGHVLGQYQDDKMQKIGRYLIEFARQYDFLAGCDTSHSNVNNIEPASPEYIGMAIEKIPPS